MYAPASADGLSFEQMESEFLQNLPAPPPVKPATAAHEESTPAVAPAPAVEVAPSWHTAVPEPEPAASPNAVPDPAEQDPIVAAPFAAAAEPVALEEPVNDTAGRELAVRQVTALEQWLGAIHVSGAEPRA